MTTQRKIIALCCLYALLPVAYASCALAQTFTPAEAELTVGGELVLNGKLLRKIEPGDTLSVHLKGPDLRATAPKPSTQPSTQPTTRPTDPPPILDGREVAVTGDGLQRAIAASKRGDRLLLSGNIQQTLVGDVFIDHDLLIDAAALTHVKIVCVPEKATEPQGKRKQAGLVVRNNARVTIRNLIGYTDYQGDGRSEYPATLLKVRLGSATVINCRGEGLDQLVKGEPGARNVLVVGCETDERHRGYGVWVDGDGWDIIRCRLRSTVEHPIRIGEDGNLKQIPRNVRIIDCDLSRPLNAVKECLTIRKGENILVERVRCYLGEPGEMSSTGYALRLGYDAKTVKLKDGSVHTEPALKNVTLRDVTVGNGVLDIKRGNFGGGFVLERVRLEGKLPAHRMWEGDALWCNKNPVTLIDVTWNGKPVN